MIKTAISAGLACVAAQLAMAETQLKTTAYTCARSVHVPATYILADDASYAVIHVEGVQITLIGEPAASGARYGWPSDGSNYVWWTKGDAATLFWKDEAGAETPVLSECREN